MKYIIIVSSVLIFSCKSKNFEAKQENKLDSSCKVCSLVKDWRFYEDDPAKYKKSIGYKLGANKFILVNDSTENTYAIRYDNDNLIDSSGNLEDEMFNSQKGLYFFGADEVKTIKYSTSKGLGFSVDFNSKNNAVQKFECDGKEVLFNKFKNNKLFVVTHNENGRTDTVVFSPN